MSGASVASLLMFAGAAAMLIRAGDRWHVDEQLAWFVRRHRGAAVRPPPWKHIRDVLSSGSRPRARLVRWACAASGACIGILLGGPPGGFVGFLGGLTGPRLLERRRRAQEHRMLERQLAELVEACALAVRGGASVAQAVLIGSQEVDEPMRSIAERMVRRQRLGSSFDEALQGFADTVGSEEARLFALVMTIRHRTGGTVTGPLDQVASTVRHRLAVRRELRALTAQGRISGTVLTVLPIAFSLVLAVTSRRELLPVYRSSAGASMIALGSVLEVVAYLWIRRLLRVEA